MNEIKFKFEGKQLLMHNGQLANPLNAYAKALKLLTAKRKKTDEDYAEIARLEWEGGLYLQNGIVVIPGSNIDRCIWDAAKMSKDGKTYRQGVIVADDYCPLAYRGKKIKVNGTKEIPNLELDKYFAEYNFQTMVKVGKDKVLRTRPIFYDWSLECTLYFEETRFDERTLLNIVQRAGAYTGLMEDRPRKGSFSVEKIN